MNIPIHRAAIYPLVLPVGRHPGASLTFEFDRDRLTVVVTEEGDILVNTTERARAGDFLDLVVLGLPEGVPSRFNFGVML